MLEEKSDLLIKAEAANIAKTNFLSMMSHEIRTPMNSVLGNTELMLATKLDDYQRSHLKTVYQSGECLLTIIDDILDFAKIETDKMSLECVAFNLHNVISGIAAELQYKIEKKGLCLSVKYKNVVPENVKGDPLRLRQVMANLLSNAVKFTEKGGIDIIVTAIDDTQSVVQLSFEVKDTGIGLEENSQAILFNSFTQADNSISRKYGGTGLGLAISKRIVELMGGTIGVHSEIGKGCSFYFTVQFEKYTEFDVAATGCNTKSFKFEG